MLYVSSHDGAVIIEIVEKIFAARMFTTTRAGVREAEKRFGMAKLRQKISKEPKIGPNPYVL